jgi:RNA polymerase sigma-70 factor (ECF subfamily)
LRELEVDVAAFEEWRSLLFGIAYRMLGSATDAEDMVQEASLRWLRRGDEPVRSVRAYLVTIVTRLCIDQLESAHATRVAYLGPWLPEPVVVDESAAVEQADSLSLAFLVLLEELTPPERAAYLLHDIFGYSFEEVGRSMGRTPVSCRQLGSRARQRIEERRHRFDADLHHGRELTDTFLMACATGDLSGLLSMLSEDVVVWNDGGGRVRAAVRPVVGPERCARFLVNVAKRGVGRPRILILNGQPAAVLLDRGAVVAALVLDIIEGRIVGIRAVLNPDKLERLAAQLMAVDDARLANDGTSARSISKPS